MTRPAILAVALVLALPSGAAAQGGGAGGGNPIVGGGSFNTAPLLKPGRYADTVAAGESVYWRVKLAKGQILEATATVDTSEIVTDPFENDYQEGLANLDYRIDIYTPLREQLADESGEQFQEGTVELEGDDEAGVKRGTARSSRVLGFEQILGAEFDASKYPAPGEWFVSVSAADDDIYPAEVPAELPLELEIAVSGSAQPSSPNFAAKLPGPEAEKPAPQESVSAAAEALPAAGGSTPPAEAGLTIGLVGALALAGGLGLGLLAGTVLRPRRPA